MISAYEKVGGWELGFEPSRSQSASPSIDCQAFFVRMLHLCRVGTFDGEMIEQRADVIGHRRAVIGGGIVELARDAVSAIVERDHPPAGARQSHHPSRMQPVHLFRGGKAVHEDDCFAHAFIEISDLDRAMLEARHSGVAIPWRQPVAEPRHPRAH